MVDFRELAEEIFLILKSYSNDLILYDDSGTRLYEPVDATRIFAQDLNILVSIVDSGENSSIKVHLANDSQSNKYALLIQTLRTCAVNSNVLFSLKKTDFAVTPDKFATSDQITESMKMNLCEGMYGTSRSSYLKLDNSKVIVRHSKPVIEGTVGARGRSIEKIFIENAIGDRFEFSPNSLIGARAFAQHINQGGQFADAISNQIIRMTSDFQNLKSSMGSIEQFPNAVMPNGVHLSVGINEAIVDIRKKLTKIARESSHKEAVANLSIISESTENNIDLIRSLTENKLGEDVMSSINKNVKMGAVAAKQDGEVTASAAGGVLQESFDNFEQWLNEASSFGVEQSLPVEEPEASVNQEPQPQLPVSVQPDDDQIDSEALAMIAAINMAQEALAQAMRANVGKFATLPAHTVVQDHIIPAIQSSIIDRKNAYDGLVNAVELALNGGDQTALMAMLDVAAAADGYLDFQDFTFSASIGDILVSDSAGPDELEIDDLPSEEDYADVGGDDDEDEEGDDDEGDDAYDDEDGDEIDDALKIPAPISKEVEKEINEASGSTKKLVLGDKMWDNDYKHWLESMHELPLSDDSHFSGYVEDENGENVLAAKWHVDRNEGWVKEVSYVDTLEERRTRVQYEPVIKEELDELIETIASVISQNPSNLVTVLQELDQFDSDRDFYKAVSQASRGDYTYLTPYLNKAANKLGLGSYGEFIKEANVKLDYLSDIGARKMADQYGNRGNIIDFSKAK